jgi:prepilin-type N-terminal cleavage/methylation domain-containing protein
MNIFKHKNGFSLIEVLVSTALFVVIITGAMNIFKLVIESQRSAIATQNVEESLKYFLEVTSKEVRMAKRNNNLCSTLGLGSTDIYKQSSNDYGNVLSFRNYHDECVSYALAQTADGNRRFTIIRNNLVNYYITPAKISIDELKFVVGSSVQPTVTMELVAHALGKDISKSRMKIQTSLSSRYYKKD